MIYRCVFLYGVIFIVAWICLSLNKTSRPAEDSSNLRKIGTNIHEAALSASVFNKNLYEENGSYIEQHTLTYLVNSTSRKPPETLANTASRSDATSISAAGPQSMTSSKTGQQLFPRWSGGIAVAPLVEGIRVSLAGYLKEGRVHVVYLVDARARMWKASVPHPAGWDDVPHRHGRREPTELLAVSTLQKIRDGMKAFKTDEYPHLKKALRQGGFAYIASYADSNFCCDEAPFESIDGKTLVDRTVPIFTLSAPVNCYHSFPVPTYETIKHAKKPWTQLVADYQKVYPWSEKKRSAVWRGSPTGSWYAENNTRIQLCELSAKRPSLVDARLTDKRHSKFDGGFNETRYIGARIPMSDYQKYRAILDVDGHSWSSRFGELLCYSSVVLKVQPSDVDYFHTQLQPWVHYIPVKSDLSDLYDMVELAVSEDARIQQIIEHANRWCLQNLNLETLTRDMARIWDTYASQLYQADPSWGRTWQAEVQNLVEIYNFTLIE